MLPVLRGKPSNSRQGILDDHLHGNLKNGKTFRPFHAQISIQVICPSRPNTQVPCECHSLKKVIFNSVNYLMHKKSQMSNLQHFIQQTFLYKHDKCHHYHEKGKDLFAVQHPILTLK